MSRHSEYRQQSEKTPTFLIKRQSNVNRDSNVFTYRGQLSRHPEYRQNKNCKKRNKKEQHVRNALRLLKNVATSVITDLLGKSLKPQSVVVGDETETRLQTQDM